MIRDDPYRTGLLMHNVLPENNFTTSTLFTTLDHGFLPSYISLVVKDESAGDDLYLNGASLGFLNWSPINGYSSAELSIPPGVYELHSADGRPYAAYVYFHNSLHGGGAGYTLLPTESPQVTPSSTVPSITFTSSTPTPSVNAYSTGEWNCRNSRWRRHVNNFHDG